MDVVDVGANIGFYSLALDLAFDSHFRVVAYEPHPVTADYLAKTVSDNGSEVLLVRAAAGRSAGIEDLHISAISDCSHSLVVNAKKDSGNVVQVQVIQLDQEVLDRGLNPLLLKIDAEGADAQVIEGGIEAIREHRPYIVVEVLNDQDADRLFDLLTGLSYRFYKLTSEFQDTPAPRPFALDSGDRNWLLSPAELDEEFFSRWRRWWRRIANAREPDDPVKSGFKAPAVYSNTISVAAHGETRIYLGSCNGILHFWTNSGDLAGSASIVLRAQRCETQLLSGDPTKIGVAIDGTKGRTKRLQIIVENRGWIRFVNNTSRDKDFSYLIMSNI